MFKLCKFITAFSLLSFASIQFFYSAAVSAETWMGLKVQPEYRCSPYSSKSYSYSQSVERRIVASIGKIYSPYTGECFEHTRQTDIEHIVSRSEAHDSGLCTASAKVRKQFSSDLMNLTLASPNLNRYQKVHYDAAEWLPRLNKCWFAQRIIDVKKKYSLTVDRREAEALAAVLAQCESTELKVYVCQVGKSDSDSDTNNRASALQLYDDNGNGRITCAEAKRRRIAPVHRGHPAYKYMHDGDGDGVVCE